MTLVHPLSWIEARADMDAFKKSKFLHFKRHISELKAHQRAAFRGDNILVWQGPYQEHAANDHKAVASEHRRIL